MASEQALLAFVRHQIEQWLREHPDRSAADLARAAGLTPAAISTIRSRARGVGIRAMRGLAGAWGLTVGELDEQARAWARANPEAVWQETRVAYETPRALTFGALPGWPEAEAEARRRYRHVPEEAWLGARGIAGASFPERAQVTPDLVLQCANLWLNMQAATPLPPEPDGEEARADRLYEELEAAKRARRDAMPSARRPKT